MGLDMYMRKVRKLNEAEISFFDGIDIRQRDSLPPDFTWISKEDFDSDPEMHSDLLPYVTQVNVIDEFFDWKKCWKDYKVNESEQIIGRAYGSNNVRFSFANGQKIELTNEEYNKYVYSAETTIYVWKSTEIDYWRKYYELDDFIASIIFENNYNRLMKEATQRGCPPTQEEIDRCCMENCGSYELSIQDRQKIKKWLQEHGEESAKKDYWDDESINVFYMAWW